MASLSELAKSIKNKRLTILPLEKDKAPIEILDVSISEDHTLNAKATKLPVEDGSDITDHVIKKGRTLAFHGIISDDPLAVAEGLTTTALGIAGNIFGSRAIQTAGQLVKLTSNLTTDEAKRSATAKANLEQIYENNIPVSIETSIGTYSNMVMEKLHFPRSSKTANSLEINAVFSQIDLVASQTVTIAIADTAAPGIKPVEKDGNKSPIVPTKAIQDNTTLFLDISKGIYDSASRAYKSLFGVQ